MPKMIMANVVTFCAEECSRQKTDAKMVACMYNAWEYAHEHQYYKTTANGAHFEEFIKRINGLILGRETPDYRFGVSPSIVGRGMAVLCTSLKNMETGEFIVEFLKIHPFEDGNGRTAAILFNFLNSRMENPLTLPWYIHEAVKGK